MHRVVFKLLGVLCVLCGYFSVAAQTPPIEPGVSHELAKWRAARYSDVRYKLNLTLEKMSPVLKGTIEIRVNVRNSPPYEGGVDAALGGRGGSPVVLDWRKIRGSEHLSTISAVTVNGRAAENHPVAEAATPLLRKEGSPDAVLMFTEQNEHLIFRDGVVPGENVIKLDFTSPILTSGSAITRYVDKEDGAEYIYSLFVPSDASTAFPVFDQPDLKARFTLSIRRPSEWEVVSNEPFPCELETNKYKRWLCGTVLGSPNGGEWVTTSQFPETRPISTYVFAFAAGPFEAMSEPPALAGGTNATARSTAGPTSQRDPKTESTPPAHAGGSDRTATSIYVRKSQAAKFKPHAAEVFRLNREGIKFLEQYFDYKFPFPKYDLVLIPEFPFGGMEHAGATFLREASIIFPTEPTKSDHISRANLIFHEAAHQWFGDTVTMKWFDDLWLKEGFAEFMAYKTLERVMPDANAWKVFFERNKQAAYLTDSTKGTTPIYQEIANLSAAKSAYGNIAYRKAPSFLRQAEFYLGPEKFQTAVRAFLKKHEYANAGWEDLVKEFEKSSDLKLNDWALRWVRQPGLPTVAFPSETKGEFSPSAWHGKYHIPYSQKHDPSGRNAWWMRTKILTILRNGERHVVDNRAFAESSYDELDASPETLFIPVDWDVQFKFLNYEDYGYGIFLLDDKSRDYVLKNIQNEKDAFLRSMMWGALWDSVREGELDPKEYVELAVKNLDVQSASFSLSSSPGKKQAKACTLNCGETDETIIQSFLGRVSTALNYYIADGVSSPHVSKGSTRPTNHVEPSLTVGLRTRFEAVLLDRLQNAPTAGQRITFYRSFVANASTAKGREV